MDPRSGVDFDTTWPATQVLMRPIKSGLGGHDDGVSGVDDGVDKTSLPLRKRGRRSGSVGATLSDFRGIANQVVCENKNDKRLVIDNVILSPMHHRLFIFRATQEKD